MWLCFVAFATLLIFQSRQFYGVVKSTSSGWQGKIYTWDGELGYKTIPHSAGIQLLKFSTGVPVNFDSYGFRSVGREPGDFAMGPKFLFLGCSYTFGFGCLAEETYPFLTGKAFSGRVYNAAVSGYGNAQMLLQAQRLIPLLKPDVVVFQVSPWLVKRSQRFFAPNYFGIIANPYFFWDEETSQLSIHPPLFKTRLFSYDLHSVRQTEASVSEFARFFFKIGMTLLTFQDLQRLKIKLAASLGAVPRPEKNGALIEDTVRKNIEDLCEKNGAKLVYLYLSQPDASERQRRLSGLQIIHVDTAGPLNNYLRENKLSYKQAFQHWKGEPLQVVDTHPNPLAHRLIAQTLVSSLKSAEQKERR